MNWTNTPSGPISAKASAISFSRRAGGWLSSGRLETTAAIGCVRRIRRASAADHRRRPAMIRTPREALLQQSAEARRRIRPAPAVAGERRARSAPSHRPGAGTEFDDEALRAPDRRPPPWRARGRAPTARRRRSGAARAISDLRKCAPSPKLRPSACWAVCVSRPHAFARSVGDTRSPRVGGQLKALEELLHLGEEAGALGMGLVRRFGRRIRPAVRAAGASGSAASRH